MLDGKIGDGRCGTQIILFPHGATSNMAGSRVDSLHSRMIMILSLY